MTTDHDSSQPSAGFSAVAEAIAHHQATYAEAFNAGDIDVLDDLYEDTGVLVPVPGNPLAGPQRTGALRHMLALGVPIGSRTRHVYVAGDIALLIVDWSIRGTASDGTEVDMSGTATDVLRRGADGRWRYVIDNPFGTGHQ